MQVKSVVTDFPVVCVGGSAGGFLQLGEMWRVSHEWIESFHPGVCHDAIIPGKIVALLFLGCLLSRAQSINVANPSFETANLTLSGNGSFSQLIAGSTIFAAGGTLANWTAASTTTNAACGAFDPSPGGVNWTSSWWAGSNIGYLPISSAGTVSLSQTVSTALQNNTTYTLSALVGRRTYTPRFNYALQLWAGPTMLVSASNLALVSNRSGTDSVSYSSGSKNPQAGQPLVIVLSSVGTTGIQTEAFFDDIALSASGAIAVSAAISASRIPDFR
jgi:hypothetical protein